MISTNNAKAYCNEDISNIERYTKAIADTEQVWICHHKLGETGISKKELIERGLYYKRPAYELIFVTKAEHNELHPDINFKNHELQKELCHRRFVNGKLPDTIKQNMRHKHNMTDVGRLSLSTYRSEQNRRRRWWNNGVINKFCEICPENFKAGRI